LLFPIRILLIPFVKEEKKRSKAHGGKRVLYTGVTKNDQLNLFDSKDADE